MADQDVETILRRPVDGRSVRTSSGSQSHTARVHPRATATFVAGPGLGASVSAALATLPHAIRRMTSLAAETMGLSRSRSARSGRMADLVLFDPTTVRDASTYDDPTASAIGVEMVLIGGEIAVEHGRPFRPSLGRVLRPEISGPRRPHRS